MAIANKLREIREAKGMTQEQLSEISDVSRTTIVSLERNTADVVKTDTLTKLADALKTPVNEIFFTQNV